MRLRQTSLCQSFARAVRCSVEWATVLFVIQLSLGESIWSPRWYDYSMSVAPEGREGVFTAMASAPLFLGKFVTGILLRVLVSEVSALLRASP